MKRILSFLLALIMMLTLCACSDDDSSTTGSKKKSDKTTNSTKAQQATDKNNSNETPHAHTWKEATCKAPKTCSTCGKTEGSVAAHDWKEATCTKPKTCSKCNTTEGSANGHNWEEINVYTKQCVTCNTTEIDQSKMPVKLGSLTPCMGENYQSTEYQKDIYGNEFSEGLFFWLYSSRTYSTEYVLNQKYNTFTTTAMVSSGSHDYFKGRLKIFVDDVLLYDSGTINKKTQPINIEIDVSNAMFIKIETIGSTPNYDSGYIMLANPTLHH